MRRALPDRRLGHAEIPAERAQDWVRMSPVKHVNDFVVKFANVNGSGSASANEMFARSILRMGVPVASRNIFPSNIQGLPTWYEVRVSGKGWLGRRGGVDLMVAMNPQTWDKDIAGIDPGGYLFYDSSKPIPMSRLRDDINILVMPLTEICNSTYSDPRQRQLFKNIIYVGALAQLLGIDRAMLEQMIGAQYKGKDKLIAPNHRALRMGHDYARDNLSGACGLKIEKADAVGDRIFVNGNDAAGLGCVYGGATVAAWYPITPSTSVAEAFAKHCGKYRVDAQSGKNKFAIVQSEDEISAIGTVIGASWNGARAFTATSGPGISLMQEFLGLAYFAEIPAVIIDVQRGGPSTGMPTRTQQADLLICAYASHGDTKHVVLLPEDPKELFEFTALSFDLAERLQTPVFVLEDLDIGMNDWLCDPFTWDDAKVYDRGKVMTAEELEAGKTFGRYLDVDGDAIPWRTLPGTHPTKGAYFTRGTSRDRFAKYSEEGSVYQDNMQRLLRKFETAKTLVPAPVVRRTKEKAKTGVIYFGSTSAAMNEALAALYADGVHLDTLRLRAFPFSDAVVDFINAHNQIFLVEQNRDAQMRSLLVNECGIDPARFISILHYDGTPITARFIIAAIAERIALKSKEAAQ
jgi:2-oxoglutarate/2-oxoacid ferredoxin oxidoreductase subunit alpha